MLRRAEVLDASGRWTSTELRALSSFPGCLEACRSPSPLPFCGSISLSDKLLLVKVQVGSKAYPNAPLAIAQPVTQLWPCPMRTCECLAVPPLPQLLQLPASSQAHSPRLPAPQRPTPNAHHSEARMNGVGVGGACFLPGPTAWSTSSVKRSVTRLVQTACACPGFPDLLPPPGTPGSLKVHCGGSCSIHSAHCTVALLHCIIEAGHPSTPPPATPPTAPNSPGLRHRRAGD